MADETDNVELNITELTIGQLLTQAREEKKISISDAASQLMLTTEMLTHLENEQWDKLHGRIYARGYFLSYVRFLGLSEDEALMAFDVNYVTKDKPKKVMFIQHETKSFPIMPVLFLALVLIGSWFAYQYWQQFQLQKQQTVEEEYSVNQSNPTKRVVEPQHTETPLISTQEN